ncbi:uncharacterized protein MELLADRAFT_69023 [Melampsora larici-populina 98AG31]|uniref:Uncharacterized protein n=1 Tax=Melampsora larici-populina (strain 98AG31 / pathotype 3-4-7) TaxID=747676 RepID=F4S947_MELLP|nr:uncharacterized protein MELLADRAFT_69023 [Melampsora larici-populina 98AG31]EGF98829.1 hypothetical protein MELLADRAFT_69023 [Melampsora larici-populina 98AG31]
MSPNDKPSDDELLRGSIEVNKIDPSRFQDAIPKLKLHGTNFHSWLHDLSNAILLMLNIDEYLLRPKPVIDNIWTVSIDAKCLELIQILLTKEFQAIVSDCEFAHNAVHELRIYLHTQALARESIVGLHDPSSTGFGSSIELGRQYASIQSDTEEITDRPKLHLSPSSTIIGLTNRHALRATLEAIYDTGDHATHPKPSCSSVLQIGLYLIPISTSFHSSGKINKPQNEFPYHLHQSNAQASMTQL